MVNYIVGDSRLMTSDLFISVHWNVSDPDHVRHLKSIINSGFCYTEVLKPAFGAFVIAIVLLLVVHVWGTSVALLRTETHSCMQDLITYHNRIFY